MDILRIGENMIHQWKLLRVTSSLSIQYSISNSMKPLWKSHHIAITEVKNIPRWRMTIVDFFGSFGNISNRIKTIPRKYHYIIVSEESSLLDKSILEDCMAKSLCKNRLPKSYHLPSESEFSWIKTPFREKPRYQICIECLRHQCHKSLSSPTIEKCIMENGYLWKASFCKGGTRRGEDFSFCLILFLFFFHTKRILKSKGKTIE